MKNILVATDFSPKAQLATEVGILLAAQFKADIHFLHVFHTPVDWTKLPKEHEGRFKEVKTKLAAAKANLASSVSKTKKMGVDAAYFVSYDHENMNVLQHIRSHEHDLVVIGAHGKLDITDLLFGSVAVDIIEKSPVPVVLVDEADTFKQVQNILIAVEPSMDVLQFVSKVSSLFPSAEIGLKAFSVQTETEGLNDKLLAGLNEMIRKYTGSNVSYEVVSAESVEQGIIAKANSGEGDLLVIGSNRFNSVADYLRTHVFPDIPERVHVPVIILR